MMSKKVMKVNAEAMDDIPTELGPALKMLGTVLQEEWMTRNGAYLNESERKERGKEPLAYVEDTVISIRVGPQRITLKPCDPDKAAVSIPVGFSDKKNTASIPRDWLLGCYVDALIEVFEGDASIAEDFAGRVNDAIDAATKTSDEGRLSVKQSDLPGHRNAVEIAEIVDSHKRHFHGKSAGSPSLNMTFEVENISGHGSGKSTAPAVSQQYKKEMAERVANTLVHNPATDAASASTTVVEPLEEEITSASPVVLHPIVESPVQPVVVEETDDGSSDLLESDIDLIVLNAINNSDGPATWGQLKKVDPEIESHRKVLDRLVKEGAVVKQGERRSTRYLLTGTGLECLVGMPLPDVISQELEDVPMLPSGDSPVAFTAEEPAPPAGGMTMAFADEDTTDTDVVKDALLGEWG